MVGRAVLRGPRFRVVGDFGNAIEHSFHHLAASAQGTDRHRRLGRGDHLAGRAESPMILAQSRIEPVVRQHPTAPLSPQRPHHLLEAYLLQPQHIVLAGDARQRVCIRVRRERYHRQLTDAIGQVAVCAQAQLDRHQPGQALLPEHVSKSPHTAPIDALVRREGMGRHEGPARLLRHPQQLPGGESAPLGAEFEIGHEPAQQADEDSQLLPGGKERDLVGDTPILLHRLQLAAQQDGSLLPIPQSSPGQLHHLARPHQGVYLRHHRG